MDCIETTCGSCSLDVSGSGNQSWSDVVIKSYVMTVDCTETTCGSCSLDGSGSGNQSWSDVVIKLYVMPSADTSKLRN